MAVNPDKALDYLDFVQERHRIWEARQQGLPQEEWATDPILQTRKFTNVFRILDPGSQYVLTDLVPEEGEGEDLQDRLLRLFLYRHTGRIEVWDWLTYAGVDLPHRGNLDYVLMAWQDYRTWTGKPVFTGAYLVYPQSHEKGTDKLDSIVRLAHRLFVEGDVAERFLSEDTQRGRFEALRNNKGVADFMSFQILTDWGYLCGDYRENDFVVPGPGARKGAALLDPSAPAEQVVYWAQQAVHSLPNCPEIVLPHGGTRKPSLVDIQNTFCEYQKYVRYSQKPQGDPYVPSHPGEQPIPVFPGGW